MRPNFHSQGDLKLPASFLLLFTGGSHTTFDGAFVLAEKTSSPDPWLPFDSSPVDPEIPGLSGVEWIRHNHLHLHPRYPLVRILVRLISDARESVVSALKATAKGCLFKGRAPRDLMAALRALVAGDAPMRPKTARKVIRQLREQQDLPDQVHLTRREEGVAEGVSLGKTDQETAARGVGTSHDAIRGTIKSIHEKLQAAKRAEAIHNARSSGVI